MPHVADWQSYVATFAGRVGVGTDAGHRGDHFGCLHALAAQEDRREDATNANPYCPRGRINDPYKMKAGTSAKIEPLRLCD